MKKLKLLKKMGKFLFQNLEALAAQQLILLNPKDFLSFKVK